MIFKEVCDKEKVNPVNHGEFERATRQIVETATREDGGFIDRCPMYAIQRCRRGGKTFMLHAVAKLLHEEIQKNYDNGAQANEHTRTLDKNTHVILISLNSDTKWKTKEDPYTAILSRIAYSWELTLAETKSFHRFREGYRDFGVVDEWLDDRKNNVILLIDELNVIPPKGSRYEDMSHMLDLLAGRRGCAVAYSTHYRSYADILRGRQEGSRDFRLSTRPHEFLPIPRVSNKLCLEGLKPETAHDYSLWSAVLRGRIPCLILSKEAQIKRFADFSFVREALEKAHENESHEPVELTEELRGKGLERRIASLASAVTGKIVDWDDHTREEFKAYSYTADKFGSNEEPLYAWPPFLLGSENALGKDYENLFGSLCFPQIDEAKAFEALSELAVLLRLLSSQQHFLVPAVQGLSSVEAYHATEMYHVDGEAQDLKTLIRRVKSKYVFEAHVMQVVVVPLFASFPIYDFFIFHRVGDDWVAAAGYQCKLGHELPNEEHDAWEGVNLSVWIGGSCRMYRIDKAGARVPCAEKFGWKVLGQDTQFDMLGVSISEALPHHVASVNSHVCEFCDAEQHMLERKEVAVAEHKRQKTG